MTKKKIHYEASNLFTAFDNLINALRNEAQTKPELERRTLESFARSAEKYQAEIKTELVEALIKI